MVQVLTWTAILALPGGVLLLPVVVAKHFAKRRAPVTADAQDPSKTSDDA